MDLVVFPKEELVAVLRALRGVACENDFFSPAEAALIEGIARLHGVYVEADALEPISPDALGAIVRDPHRRRRALQLAMVTALVEGVPSRETDRAVLDVARALGFPDEGVHTLHEIASGHVMLARFDFMQRMRGFVTRDRGLPGFFQLVVPMLLGTEDAAMAERYRALGRCAPGTLGRALYTHYREHGFKLPGEAGGIPEIGVFHDVGHVFSGYGVDPQGEIQQAAFQAGFVRNDGFLFLLFGILQFHVGIRLTPIAKAEEGYFDVPRVLRALARGAACKMDFSDRFDVFAHADEPLEALRDRWEIPPIDGEIAQATSPRSPRPA